MKLIKERESDAVRAATQESFYFLLKTSRYCRWFVHELTTFFEVVDAFNIVYQRGKNILLVFIYILFWGCLDPIFYNVSF